MFDTFTAHEEQQRIRETQRKHGTLTPALHQKPSIKGVPYIQFVCSILSYYETWRMHQKKQNSTSTAQQHASPTRRLCRTAKIKKTRCIQFACVIRVRRKTWCSMSRSRWWRHCDAGFCVACKLVFSLICLVLGLKLLFLQHVCNCSFNLSCGILQLQVCYFVFPVFVLFFLICCHDSCMTRLFWSNFRFINCFCLWFVLPIFHVLSVSSMCNEEVW